MVYPISAAQKWDLMAFILSASGRFSVLSSGTCEVNMMRYFCKKDLTIQPLTIFTKKLHIDVWQDHKHLFVKIRFVNLLFLL